MQAVIIDSEDSDKFHKLSKQQLNYKILILEEENKKLRLDNARLRTLRCINEGKSAFLLKGTLAHNISDRIFVYRFREN